MKENRLKNIGTVLGVVFLLLFLGVMVSSLLRKGIWSDQMGINLLVVGDDSVGLLILRPKEGMGSWVALPSDLKIKISGSQATYPINSIWKFGVGEKRGFQITEKSIGESMGVVIPKMVRVDGDASIEGALGMLLSFTAKTDLSLLDRLAVRKYLSEIVVSKRLLELTIPDQVYEEVVEPDGKVFFEFSQVMTAWSKDKFLFDSVLAENIELIVNNLSGQSGAGLILARMAETAGIRVVEVKNDKEDAVDSRGCVFKTFGDGDTATVELLVNHFNCKKLDVKGEERGEIKAWLL